MLAAISAGSASKTVNNTITSRLSTKIEHTPLSWGRYQSPTSTKRTKYTIKYHVPGVFNNTSKYIQLRCHVVFYILYWSCFICLQSEVDFISLGRLPRTHTVALNYVTIIYGTLNYFELILSTLQVCMG